MSNDEDDVYDDAESVPWGPRAREAHSGGPRVEVPLNGAGMVDMKIGPGWKRVVADGVNYIPGPYGKVAPRMGGERVVIPREQLDKEIRRQGGDWVRLPLDPRMSPLTRPGAMPTALPYNPETYVGGPRARTPPFAVKQALSMSMEAPDWLLEWLYAEYLDGNESPSWLASMVYGKPGGDQVLRYAAILDNELRGGS